MDPIERLAADVQQLKSRFDEMTLRFAVSEEREKRLNDKIDNLSALLRLKLDGVEKSMQSWNATGRWVLVTLGAVVVAAIARWMLAGGLAGF